MSDYLRRLVDRYRPDGATAFVPNANLYASRGAVLEASAASTAAGHDDQGPDAESMADARETAAGARFADFSDSARSQMTSAGAAATILPPAPADRAARRPLPDEASGAERPGNEAVVELVSPGSPVPDADASDPAAATSIRPRSLGTGDQRARAQTVAPGQVSVPEVGTWMATPVTAPVAPGISSPGGHTLPTAEAQITPATRTGVRATAMPAEASSSRPSARDRPAPDPARGPAVRHHPLASGEAEAPSDVVAPAASSPQGAPLWPGDAPSRPTSLRANRQPTAEAHPVSRPGDGSMSPIGDEAAAPVVRPLPATAQEATMRLAGAALAPGRVPGQHRAASSPDGLVAGPGRAPTLVPSPPGQLAGEKRLPIGDGFAAPDARSLPATAQQPPMRAAGPAAAPDSLPDHQRTMSRPPGLVAERGRAATLMPVQPGQPAGEKATAQSRTSTPGIESGAMRSSVPIAPATVPEPRRLPAAPVAPAEAVSIRIGSVEFHAPPAPAPAPASRAAGVATPRLSLDEYLRGRRSRHS